MIVSLSRTTAIYMMHADKMIDRDLWAAEWARDAANETPLPATKEDYERALRVAFHAGAYCGVDSCKDYFCS
jgi:hypothetical protein